MLAPPKMRMNPLLQFRAGKTTYEEGIVISLPTKGYLSLFPRDSESIELVWSCKETKDSIILIRGKCDVSFVDQCTTGRVLLFDIKGDSPRKYFFWLQEKSRANDAEWLAKANQLLAPLPAGSSGAAVKLEDLKKILANISAGGPQDLNLAEIVSSSKVTEALREDPEFYMSRLKEFLPPGSEQSGDVVEQVKNPQVSAAASALNVALHDPLTYKEVCKAFDVPETDARGGVQAFLNGIKKAPKKP